MRRRSGALYSDSEEKYLDIAIKCQKSDNLFSSSLEDEDDTEVPDRRSLSSELGNFDYNSDLPDNRDVYPSSYPPKNLLEYDLKKDSPILNLKAGSKALSFSIAGLENEQSNTKIAKIMVIGETSSGRKTFVNSLFPLKEKTIPTKDPRNPYQNYCLDLIVHSFTAKSNEKVVFKFWIQNLSNEKFDNIIKNLFVLVCDAEKLDALEKLGKCFDDIRESISNVKAIMVVMQNKKKEVDLSLARKFAETKGIQDIFKVRREDKSNLSILEKLTEIVLPGIRVKGKFK